ncbi:guanylate cyclase [Echinococcus multilocularis]|uniref:Guanylate cyclase n=1 Tax=Echinococcus multilocularis TaxID=6211 RepID=A0A0S4MPD0_ECHMU|nr:guanylate cyclase [Echinococcus multilocularis]
MHTRSPHMNKSYERMIDESNKANGNDGEMTDSNTPESCTDLSAAHELSCIQVGVQAVPSRFDPSSEVPPKENCLRSVGRLTPFARIGTPSLPSPSTWVENDSTPPTLHLRPELMRQLSSLLQMDSISVVVVLITIIVTALFVLPDVMAARGRQRHSSTPRPIVARYLDQHSSPH